MRGMPFIDGSIFAIRSGRETEPAVAEIHRIADGETRHVGSDRFDDPGAVRTEHDGLPLRRERTARAKLVIDGIEPRSDHAHENIGRTNRGLRKIDEFENVGTPGRAHDDGFHAEVVPGYDRS